MKHVDITNKRYKRLTAIERVEDYISPKGYKQERWLFRCDCGNYIIRSKNLVTRGECSSCGCAKSERITVYNKLNKKIHGLHYTRLYRIWGGIKTRCFNKSNPSYRWYGNQGVTMCDEWRKDFQTFYSWAISNGYQNKLTIDRINTWGDYEPTNCRWVNIKTQNRNKRNNLLVEINNEIRCLAEWGELYNFNPRKEKYKILKDKEYLKCLILEGSLSTDYDR